MPGAAPTSAALGRAVRELRSRRELSQEALARVSGLHPTYISGIERGHRNPSWTTIGRLAVALGVELSELVALSERLLDEAP